MRWTLATGNLSNDSEDVVIAAGMCGLQEECSLAVNSSRSTRRLRVQLALDGLCNEFQLLSWSLPVSSVLGCTDVDYFLGSVSSLPWLRMLPCCACCGTLTMVHGWAEEVTRIDNSFVAIGLAVALGLTLCFIVTVCCRRRRQPTFSEKPSRYFKDLELNGEGFELN